jgi:hypothetical protein
MKKVTVYQSENCTTDNYVACMAILRHAMIPYSTEVDVRKMMTLANGTANPTNGFAMVTKDGTVMRNFMHLTAWIERNGIMPL